MRPLSAPPRVIVDPGTHLPAFGSYQGDLPRIDLKPLGTGPLFAFTHEKRWFFGSIAGDDLFVGFLVIHLGYAANHFVFVFDRRAGRMLVERSSLTLPALCDIGDRTGEGCAVRYAQPLAREEATVRRLLGSPDYTIELSAPGFSLDARLSTQGAPPPIGAIAPLGRQTGRLVQVTEKHALLKVDGEVRIDGQRRSLDGSLGGIDFSHGYVPRAVDWRWAFLLGRAATGERVGINLVEGFVGELECAAWIEDQIFPVGEGRFSFDPSRPLDPWQVRSADGAVDLRFEPGAIHAEHRNLVVVSSNYVQPVGNFSGSIQIEGRGKIIIERALGVVEDQRVVW